MPPFGELALRSYDWDHDARETVPRWDFSRPSAPQCDRSPFPSPTTI